MLVYSRIFMVNRYPEFINLYNARLSVTYAMATGQVVDSQWLYLVVGHLC